MRDKDPELSGYVRQILLEYSENITSLNGLYNESRISALVAQIVDSFRRVRYVQIVAEKNFTESSTNSNISTFDPLRAASWYSKNNQIEEALWLIFLVTHFGKNRRTGWNLLRAVYNKDGADDRWNWINVTRNQGQFSEWINQNQSLLEHAGNFGNHRKYQSRKNISLTVMSYVEWIGSPYNQVASLQEYVGDEQDPRRRFATLYAAINIFGFGRMARFDFLTMVGKLRLFKVEPDKLYLAGATGPIPGAKLLIDNSRNSPRDICELERILGDLEELLGFPFGMQILEDALCNWQKDPSNYRYFSG